MMTTEQLVDRFGAEKCSPQVKSLYDQGQYYESVKVVHAIVPNRDQDLERGDWKGMPWASIWFEKDGGDSEQLLSEGGFEEWPAATPRWGVTGEDVYGYSPGMETLGDVKALQQLEKESALVMEKITRPPMKAHTGLETQAKSTLPGSITYADDQGARSGWEPVFVPDSRAATEVEKNIARHEYRINAGFYADLFLMLAATDKPNMTATEVQERHEEKMLQIGPALERLQDELLDPIIERVFFILLRKGLVDEPPIEAQGREWKIEYISILAQAQKLLETVGVERLTNFILSLAEANPEVLDKLNFDQTADTSADLLGTPANLIRADDEVAKIRAQRQQQMEAEEAKMAAAAMKDTTQAGKNLSDTNVSDPSALKELLAASGVTG
jgi:hypothetical protein